MITEATSGDVSTQTGKPFIGWYVTYENVRYQVLEAQELAMYGRRRFMKIVGRFES